MTATLDERATGIEPAGPAWKAWNTAMLGCSYTGRWHGGLAVSDRESPRFTVRPGTQRARRPRQVRVDYRTAVQAAVIRSRHHRPAASFGEGLSRHHGGSISNERMFFAFILYVTIVT